MFYENNILHDKKSPKHSKNTFNNQNSKYTILSTRPFSINDMQSLLYYLEQIVPDQNSYRHCSS